MLVDPSPEPELPQLSIHSDGVGDGPSSPLRWQLNLMKLDGLCDIDQGRLDGDEDSMAVVVAAVDESGLGVDITEYWWY